MTSAEHTLILDNGAYSIKAGYTTDGKARIYPNSVFKTKADRKRVYVSDELDECKDRSSLYFVLPFERGYLVNWDTQLQIWNRLFDKDRLNVDFQQCRLVLTDPSDIARAFADNTEEIIFENFRFHSLLKTSAASCSAQLHCTQENPCCIVVDSGHSFTHIVPFVQGQIVRNAVIRVDIGGKALTNQLKDWISYRQLNVMDETYVINCCKEDVCFVSTNFQKDMDNWRAKHVDYILPDFLNLMRGQVCEPKISAQMANDTQKLNLAVERFALSELLFHPNDMEVNQMGLVEALHASLLRLPKEMQFLMAQNIVLVGGNSLFPGFRDRIELDLRAMLDDSIPLNIFLPTDPIEHPWECARKALAAEASTEPLSQPFASKFISRAEYEEHGVGICRRRFGNYWLDGEAYIEEQNRERTILA